MKNIFTYSTVFLMILFSVILGCKTQKDQKSNDTITIKADTEAGDTLFIHSSVRIIPLEVTEESAIGNIYKILKYKNEFFIVDQTHRDVKIFNNEGTYIRKLSRLGKGPGEYISISDIVIFDGSLYILSNQGNINAYNIDDFKFIRDLKKPEDISQVMEFFVDSLYFYFGNLTSHNNKKYIHVYQLSDNKFKEVDKFINISVENLTQNKMLMLAHTNSIIPNVNNNGFIFNQSFDNSLYEFKNGYLKTKYELDFGQYSIPKNVLNINFDNIEKYMKQHDQVRHISGFAKKGQDFIFEIKSGFFGKRMHLIYNSKTTKSKMYSELFLPAFYLKIKIYRICDNGFIGVLMSNDIYNRVTFINNKKKKGNVDINEKEEQFMNIFNENSNPALIIFNVDRQY